MLPRLIALAACLGPLSAAAPVLAAPSSASVAALEGRVIAFELGKFVLDIAADQGVSSGSLVELWRPLSIKHPVTGQMVSDRFLIGRLRLTQVRTALSLARAEGKLAQPAQPGDIVVLRRSLSEARPAISPSEAPSEATSAPATAPPNALSESPGSAQSAEPPCAPALGEPNREAAEVSALFEQLRGKSVAQRVASYEKYSAQHPGGQYAIVLYEEAVQLRRLLGSDADHALGPNGEPTQSRSPLLRHFDPPKEARSHVPLSIGIEVEGPLVVAAVIHSRDSGEVAFHSAPMKRVGAGYFSATIDAGRMRSPRLEYFVEGVAADGQPLPLLNSAEAPEMVEVFDVPHPTIAPRLPATVSLSSDYADWNNLKGNDWVWQTEGSVGMRFQDLGVRAARTGFGVYRGRGGSLEELDEEKISGRSVGLTYGYLEGEYGLSHFTSLIGRLVIGLGDDGVNGGAQALLRLGNDRETNLTIGGEALGGIGLRGITELQLASFERVPILFRTEVTNQPAGVSRRYDAENALVARAEGEVGVRAIAQVGYRLLPEFVIALRGSYQGRTINHAGPGFGGAVTYQW